MLARQGLAATVAVLLSGTAVLAQEAQRLLRHTRRGGDGARPGGAGPSTGPAIAAIVGPDFAELIKGQGAEANATDRERFLAAAQRATVLRPDGDDRRILEVGLTAWPVPAPLVHEAGGWRFDGEEGSRRSRTVSSAATSSRRSRS